MDKITIYTNEACSYCKQIKTELQKNNIEFESKLTSEWQEEWNEIVSLTSLPSTPTIQYKGSYFVPARDFATPQQLVQILENFKGSKFDESRQALERIKTLNYNMSGAFNRMEQLLLQIDNRLKIM